MLLSDLILKKEAISPSDIPCIEVSNIAVSSANANENSVFVCLMGSINDGHNYADNAYMKGCRCFVCEHDFYISGNDAVIIKVENTRKMLSRIAARFYRHPSKELKVIGITGTKGKTTTSLIINAVMNKCNKNCGYIGSNGISFNGNSYKTANTTPESHILQKTLREMLDSGVKYAVLEVSSQALHTYRVDDVKFDTVVFTNLARDHIGKFEHPTLEHYIESKASLFTDKYSANYCVFNADDAMHETITKSFNGKKLSYSACGNGDVNAENIKYYQSSNGIGVLFDIRCKKNVYPAFLPIPGDFNVYNAICAFSVCKKYTDDFKTIADSMADIKVDGRLEMYRTDKGCTFVIDYAHNGLSLASALRELRKYCKGKLICLFGSVGDRTFERRKELGEAAGMYSDFCIISSDNPGYEAPEKIIDEIAYYVALQKCPYVKSPDRETAIKYAYRFANSDDIILLAGKGHEEYQLVNGRNLPFSERKIIESIIKEEKVNKINF